MNWGRHFECYRTRLGIHRAVSWRNIPIKLVDPARQLSFGDGADGNNVDATVEAVCNTGRDCIEELIHQSEAVRVGVIVGLQYEPRPIPFAPRILVPRPVGEFLCDVTRRHGPDIGGYAFTSENYPIHVRQLV